MSCRCESGLNKKGFTMFHIRALKISGRNSASRNTKFKSYYGSYNRVGEYDYKGDTCRCGLQFESRNRYNIYDWSISYYSNSRSFYYSHYNSQSTNAVIIKSHTTYSC